MILEGIEASKSEVPNQRLHTVALPRAGEPQRLA
jgi:hypothetical protein